MRIQLDGRCPLARTLVFTGHQVCRLLDLGLPASRTVRNKCWLFKSPSLLVLLYQPKLGQ